jgi:5-methylthioadenosine/S-adenosylhomocysteine deaminase
VRLLADLVLTETGWRRDCAIAIAAGRLADLVAVDLGHPSLHPPIDLLRNVVYAMSPQAVTDVWVHGRRVVEGGRLVTVDIDELLARVRELTKGWRV